MRFVFLLSAFLIATAIDSRETMLFIQATKGLFELVLMGALVADVLELYLTATKR